MAKKATTSHEIQYAVESGVQMRNEELGMRNDKAKQREKPMQSKRPTERSEQKVQGHAPGQGQGVKPIVGVWGTKPLAELEAEPQ